MDVLRMKGAWGPLTTAVYDAVVVPALRDLYAELMEQYLPLGELPKQGRLLDVGCGPGHALALVRGWRPHLDLVGVDLSPEMIRRARERYGAVSGARFEVADAAALPFGDGTFDVALSLASIKHWPAPERGVAELRRVLRPGGFFFLLEAARGCTQEEARNFVGRWRWTPALLRPLVVAYFRRVVAPQGLSLADLRAHAEGAGLVVTGATQAAGWPGVMVWGRRAA